MSQIVKYNEEDDYEESSSSDDSSSDDSSSDDEDTGYITNNIKINEKRFSYRSLFMYLFIFAGAVIFIVTASLDPRESQTLYITAGALLGFAFLALFYIYR